MPQIYDVTWYRGVFRLGVGGQQARPPPPPLIVFFLFTIYVYVFNFLKLFLKLRYIYLYLNTCLPPTPLTISISVHAQSPLSYWMSGTTSNNGLKWYWSDISCYVYVDLMSNGYDIIKPFQDNIICHICNKNRKCICQSTMFMLKHIMGMHERTSALCVKDCCDRQTIFWQKQHGVCW